MDKEKTAEAVNRYADMVFRIAWNCVKNKESAEDITQNVFIKLLKTKDHFVDDEHLKRWLIRCTVNEGRDLLSSAWYRKRIPLEEIAEIGMKTDEKDSELFDAIMRLPKRCRIVCYMHYYEGYTTDEIADILNISSATVRVQLMKARKRLKSEWMEDLGYDRV